MLLEKLVRNLAVRVEPFAICEVAAGWRLSLPGPPDVMLHFVLRGRGAIRDAQGGQHRIAASCLAVVPCGAAHALEGGAAIREERRVNAAPSGPPARRIVAGSPSSSDLVVACGLIHAQYRQSLGLFDHLRHVMVADLSAVPQVRGVFEEILREQTEDPPATAVMTGSLMTQCLVHMLRHLLAQGQHDLPWLKVLEDPQLAPAIDLILDHPGFDHSVTSLAEAARMSRSAFAQRFAAAFGRPPMNLVHHVRMQRAAELLQYGALSIDQVAGHIGFASRSHFSRAFKRHTGLPPSVFQHAARDGDPSVAV